MRANLVDWALECLSLTTISILISCLLRLLVELGLFYPSWVMEYMDPKHECPLSLNHLQCLSHFWFKFDHRLNCSLIIYPITCSFWLVGMMFMPPPFSRSRYYWGGFLRQSGLLTVLMPSQCHDFHCCKLSVQ